MISEKHSLRFLSPMKRFYKIMLTSNDDETYSRHGGGPGIGIFCGRDFGRREEEEQNEGRRRTDSSRGGFHQ